MTRALLAAVAAAALAAVPASAFAGSGGSANQSPLEALLSLFVTPTETQLGPDDTGQPGAECGEEETPNTPGHASTAQGSAFNEEGTAHGVYAGEQPQNSKNTASVSQYDSACLHVPAPH